MKKITIYRLLLIGLTVVSLSGCYKLQTDYKYNAFTLDPKINMTAKDYLLSRGTAGVGADTIFKWMQLGIEYAGIDLAEYEKTGRTYIFLHNSAIRTLGTVGGVTNQTNGGFFYDYPIPVFDATGNPLKSKLDPTADSLRPAKTWDEYPKSFVKNYFLYLILQGDYTFENLTVNNLSIPTLLPPGTVADPKVSKLGWVVTKTSPNPDATLAANIYFDKTIGKGFDPEGKINLKLVNSQDAPIMVNDRVNDRSAGYFATNGKIHVYDKTIGPFRYSYP
ncbi:MAG: hypothetical protein JWN76_281 [Chitinophagaceae bacterium]|nr:hypothetical protein [Chitinophagaceae bacterium]